MEDNNKNLRAVSWKFMSRERVAEAVALDKENGKVVVFTNGCFDILHVGHVRYLQDARAQGDKLVVAVNSDESVRKLKGPDRPILSENERVEILAALECVDYVTIFGEQLPIDVILAIKPNIQVKGGDYKEEDLPEAEYVRSIGGKVVIVPFSTTDSEGVSTTNVIDKIVKGYKG